MVLGRNKTVDLWNVDENLFWPVSLSDNIEKWCKKIVDVDDKNSLNRHQQLSSPSYSGRSKTDAF